jgi:hypothetical protein
MGNWNTSCRECCNDAIWCESCARSELETEQRADHFCHSGQPDEPTLTKGAEAGIATTCAECGKAMTVATIWCSKCAAKGEAVPVMLADTDGDDTDIPLDTSALEEWLATAPALVAAAGQGDVAKLERMRKECAETMARPAFKRQFAEDNIHLIAQRPGEDSETAAYARATIAELGPVVGAVVLLMVIKNGGSISRDTAEEAWQALPPELRQAAEERDHD